MIIKLFHLNHSVLAVRATITQKSRFEKGWQGNYILLWPLTKCRRLFLLPVFLHIWWSLSL